MVGGRYQVIDCGWQTSQEVEVARSSGCLEVHVSAINSEETKKHLTCIYGLTH